MAQCYIISRPHQRDHLVEFLARVRGRNWAPTYSRGCASLFLLFMKELSIFVDESGHFGKDNNQNNVYIIILVIHDQNKNITKIIDSLVSELKLVYPNNDYFHGGPILRREQEYKNVDIHTRRKLFNVMSHFTNKIDFKYLSIVADKRICYDDEVLYYFLSKNLNVSLIENIDYFSSFDSIKIYYDNGQKLLKKIIFNCFSTSFQNVVMNDIDPHDYTLFQVADFISTLELVNISYKNNSVTNSELYFFGSYSNFKRNYFRQIEKKKL